MIMKKIVMIIVALMLLPCFLMADSGKVFQIRPVSSKPSSKSIKMLDRNGDEYFVLNDVLASDSDLERAYISEETNIKGAFRIIIFFKKMKAYKLYDLTKKYTGQNVAIILDNKLITAPIIFEPLKGDSFAITSFTYSEAKKIAERLNSTQNNKK
jgi:preprotein translocase subunit SecD